MDRRRFLTAASCGFGLSVSMIQETPTQTTPGRFANRSLRRIAPPESGLISVACAISKGTTEIDYVGPQAVFETWYRDPVTHKPAPRFKVFTVSESLDAVDGRIPDYTFETVHHPQIVVVPAQSGSSALHAWLKTIYATTDVTMSVCIGARHLAKAGLLTGKQATTHHDAIAAFEKEFPDVHWVRGVRFVETDKVSTGGGLTAGIDLALHVVERYFGRESAQGVAEHLEYEGTHWMTS